MSMQPGSTNWLVWSAMVLILPIVSACNSEMEEDQGSGGLSFAEALDPLSHGVPWCPRFIYIDGGWHCEQTYSGSSQNTSGIALLINGELEPNDTPSAANVMRYPSRSGTTTHVGWQARGSVSDAADVIDYYIFTAPLSRDYVLRLCPNTASTCHGTTGLDTRTAFLDLLDSDGNILLSSQAAGTNAYEVAIDAGVVYYVRILAGDTSGDYVAYDLQAFERK